MGEQTVTVTVTARERKILEPLARAKAAPQRLVERCRIVLLSAAGWGNEDQADDLVIDRQYVRRWRRRWAKARPALVAAETRDANAEHQRLLHSRSMLLGVTTLFVWLRRGMRSRR